MWDAMPETIYPVRLYWTAFDKSEQYYGKQKADLYLNRKNVNLWRFVGRHTGHKPRK